MDADEELARKLQAEEDAAAATLSLASLHLPQSAATRQPTEATAVSQPAPSLPGWTHPDQAAFMHQMQDGIRKAKGYEDDLAQAMALSVMDLGAMQLKAAEAASLSALLQEDPPLAEEDALAMELLSWFKLEFFSWVDRPACSFCQNSSTQSIETSQPTPEEAEHLASRTEIYYCNICGTMTRFPRYNDPVKLLETRRGRCGEWANCFALCCRAAGLDTRLVLDWTDHIWVEYYSSAAKRWIHMDPCEAAIDKPLLYESGWGKNLSYLIAIGRDGVADVSKRYTRQYTDLLRRRPLNESWVDAYLKGVNGQIRAGMPLTAVTEFEKRDAADEESMNAAMSAPLSENNLDLPGRQTGSVEWVSSRGEGGEQTSLGAGVDGGSMNTNTNISEGISSRCGVPSTAAAQKKFNPPGTRYQWARDTITSSSEIQKSDSRSGGKNLIKICGGVVRASGENSPGEIASRAFDGSVSTKWLDFGGCTKDTAWLEYRLLPTDKARVIREYFLVSANDEPGRDPEHIVIEAWEEERKNNGTDGTATGQNNVGRGSMTGSGREKGRWIAIDERQGIRFQRRGQRLDFQISREVESQRWRLRVVSVLYPNQANSVQLACWELYAKE